MLKSQCGEVGANDGKVDGFQRSDRLELNDNRSVDYEIESMETNLDAPVNYGYLHFAMKWNLSVVEL